MTEARGTTMRCVTPRPPSRVLGTSRAVGARTRCRRTGAGRIAGRHPYVAGPVTDGR